MKNHSKMLNDMSYLKFFGLAWLFDSLFGRKCRNIIDTSTRCDSSMCYAENNARLDELSARINNLDCRLNNLDEESMQSIDLEDELDDFEDEIDDFYDDEDDFLDDLDDY